MHDARALRCGARLGVPGGALDLGDPKGDLSPALGAVGAGGGTGTVLIGVRNPLPFRWPCCTHHQFWRPSWTRWAPSHARGALSQVQGALSQVQGHPATFAGTQPPPGRTRPAVDRPRCVRARTDATRGAAAPEPPAPRAPGRRGEVPGVRTAPSRPASPGTEARLCTSGLPKRETVLKTRLGIRPGGQSLAPRDDCPFYLCSVCSHGTSSL